MASSGSEEKPSILARFKAWHIKLSPEARRRFNIWSVVVILFCIAMTGYALRDTKSRIAPPPDPKKQRRAIQLDEDILKKSELYDKDRAVRDKEKEVEDLQKKLSELEGGLAPGDKKKSASARDYPNVPLPGSDDDQGKERSARSKKGSAGSEKEHAEHDEEMRDPALSPTPGSSRKGRLNGFPPPPGSGSAGFGSNVLAGGGGPMSATVETQLVGDIATFPNTQPVEQKTDLNGKKKEPQKIYLPPSFMGATLLSGMDAPTSGEGKGSPVPVLIRIRDLAVLPNKVKANLKGCFAMAEGIGSLSDERAHIRLLSISCLAKDGKSVVDNKVKGFVVDVDGKNGLSGKVVQKMGSLIARSLLAGFFEGIGQGLKQASQTTLMTASGSLSTMDSGELVQGAAGYGIAQAAGDVRKFYLDMAKQIFPVIEIPGSKDITLVISEGVDLEIKNFCSRGNQLGGGKCDD